MTDDHDAMVRDFSAPLVASKGWMKFLGVMYIIMGVLTALSIVGIIVAWVPIWLGVLLVQAANATEESASNGSRDSFQRALSKLKTFFIVNGVLMLIVVALYVIMFIGMASMGLTTGMF